MVQWDRWWFFENEVTQKGGLGEWCIHSSNNYNDDEFIYHPSEESHKKFSKEVATPLVLEMLKNEKEQRKPASQNKGIHI